MTMSRFQGAQVQLPAELNGALDGALQRKVQQGVDRVVAGVALARDRALAHCGNATRYPIPADRASLEQIFVGHLRTVPERERERRIAEAVQRIGTTGSARERLYGELSRVGVGTKEPTTKLVAGLGLRSPFSAADLRTLEAVRVSGTPRAARAFSRLELDIQQVRCVKKTVNFGELDSLDEIILSAGVSSARAPGAARQVALGKFGKGDEKAVTPDPFFSFPLNRFTFPAGLMFLAELIEKDRGTPPARPGAAETDIAALMFGAFGAAFFGLSVGQPILLEVASATASVAFPVVLNPAVSVGLAIAAAGVAIAGGVSLIVRGIRALGEDEHYPVAQAPQLLLTDASSTPAAIGKTQTLEFVATSKDQGFKGHYELDYVWRLK